MKRTVFLLFLLPLGVFGQDNTVKIKRSILASAGITFPLKDTMLVGIENTLTLVLDAPYKVENVVIDCQNAKLIKKEDGSFAVMTNGTETVTITFYMNNRVLGERTYTPVKINDKMAPRVKRIMEGQ